MATILFANNAKSTLAAGITNVAASVTLAAGTGALFPSPSAGQYFLMTFKDAATLLLAEIVQVTAVSGDIMTIVRAQEGTTAQSWLAGDVAANLLTAGTMTAFLQSSSVAPTRIVTASGVFVMTTADANGAVGLNRTTSVAASSTTLPSGATAGQTYSVEDLASNFNGFPVTVNYPAAQVGPGGAVSALLNVNKQRATFRYYGSNQWSGL